MTVEKTAEDNGKIKLQDGKIYAILSFVIGIIVGIFTIRTGFSYYYAGYPAHGPVGVLGVFFWIFGLLTILGSILVLMRRARIVGAVLILIFGIMSGAQGMGIFIASIFDYSLSWLLPIASFVLAWYARKLDRTLKATSK